MNFFQILSEIEKVDPEVYDRLDSRRSVFKHMSGLGQKLTAAAIPLAVGAVFSKAYGQTPANLTVINVLNFALKLEYLESYFYNLRPTSLFNSDTATSLNLIATDEANHVKFLRDTITALGGTPITAPATTDFDYTGSQGGKRAATFGNYLTNVGTYLAIAQSFEDTGVRAYKGAAPLTAVMANKTVLTAALNIHSVEARHASQLRAIRRALAATGTVPVPSQGIPASPYNAAPKSWISGTDNGGASPSSSPVATTGIYGVGNDTGAATYGAGTNQGPAAGIYFRAESNVIHGDSSAGAGYTLSTATSTNFTGFPASAFSEAFDEGLDVGTVAAIANNFSTSGTYFN